MTICEMNYDVWKVYAINLERMMMNSHVKHLFYYSLALSSGHFGGYLYTKGKETGGPFSCKGIGAGWHNQTDISHTCEY